MSHKLIIGLTGGIGSGKSTVANILASMGAAIIDSDRINREQLAQSEVMDELRSWWGDSVITNASGGDVVDRGRVGEIVFADDEQRRRLEQLLHPRIEEQRKALIRQYQNDPSVRMIVLDSPLLLEAGLGDECDVVVFVDADDDVRRRRVTRHRGWSETDWKSRENSQFALDKKRARSDYIVVNNSSDHAQLRMAVTELLKSLNA